MDHAARLPRPDGMTRFLAVLEYDGAPYHGWQLQKDIPTIQGTLENALQEILNTPTRVHGAGRTDAGVHAVGQVAHFDAQWNHAPASLQRACNALLPRSIAVVDLVCAPESFHARHSAREKTYQYLIRNTSDRSPLLDRFTWHVKPALTVERLQAASRPLVGTHDFASFGAATGGTPSTERTVLHVAWCVHQASGCLSFTIRGTGFLRYMVRSLVGTLVLAGLGKLDPAHMTHILAARDRSQAGPTAPPQGLFLRHVHYPAGPCHASQGPGLLQALIADL